ncbi:putative polyketide synthase [Xylariales sp. PMI_506]|nr:putative polyketide synthase [Xylariales sp. PMI_506]
MTANNEFPVTPIAICGMGVRLPGGIKSATDLFQFLVNKGDARTSVPETRYNVESFYDPDGKPGSVSTKYGYYLDVDLAQFDTSMFNVSNAELETMDPSQRLLLEVTREALEAAGEADFRGKNIGTFIGDFTEDWQDLQNLDLLNSAPYQLTGKQDFVLSNRLAFEYNLLGPSITVKTACSSTAEAVREAVLAIRSGSCPSAVVAGANIILTPRASIGMSSMGLLAPDGNCKTFDASADGFARGESVCALYIKRLDHAIRDGNPIRAVIRACDGNSDGGDGSRTFGTPNPVAQERLIRHTYASVGLPLAQTKVVELHGTGTPIGDPLETAAIAECFGGGETVFIGSVKPNLGHGEGGSVMASIIKAVVALENKVVIPNIKFNTPNPKIPWKRNLKVPIEPIQWPEGVHERISINSFGLGGSNVHVSPDLISVRNLISLSGSHPHKSLLLLSGNSPASVSKIAENYGEYLSRNPSHLDSMAYTLASRRERLKLGTYCIADGTTISAPAPPVENKGVRHVAFVFTGQGAQWVGMGRDMMLENMQFAASIQKMDEVLKTLEHPPAWTLEELLMAVTDDKDLLTSSDRSQPVCTAVQVAYVDSLRACGIQPSAVVGHSSGEIAGAYAAGVLTLREAIITAYYRGYGCAQNKKRGGMAAVGLGREKVEEHLKSDVVVACENSHASITISGDLEGVTETMNSLKKTHPDVFVRKLRVPMGYHSPHMTIVAELYSALLVPHLDPKPPCVPFYSTVYGRKINESKVFDAQYWKLNMIQPVLFCTAVTLLLADFPTVAHLEIGPHSALAGPLRQIYRETGCSTPYATIAERGEDTSRSFLTALGQLYCFGLTLQVPVANAAYTLPDLPPYPWFYDSHHWAETRMMADWRFRKHPKHELLGHRVLESSEVEPAWRNMIRLSDVPWLADHCVEKDVVFPAAGYIAMAGAAIAQLEGSTSYTVQNVNIAAAMLLDEGRSAEVVTTLRKQSLTTSKDSKWWEFSITSESNGVWIKRCWGLVADGCAVAHPTAPDVTPENRIVDSKRWYKALQRIGLNYSNRFVGLERVTASPVAQSATACISDCQNERETYVLHPSTMDVVLQSWSVAVAQGECHRLDKLFLPTFIQQFYIGACGNRTSIRVRSTSEGRMGSSVGHSYGVIDSGQLAFVLNGFESVRMETSFAQQAPELKYMSIQWHPAFDFAPAETLIRPARDATEDIKFLEQFGLLCAAEIQDEVASVASLAQPFFQHFLDGVARHMEQVKQGLSQIPDAASLQALSREARLQQLVAWRGLSRGGPVENMTEALWRVCTNIRDILEGRNALLDILLAGGVLQGTYDESNSWSDIGDFFRVLGLNKPQVRVLEIGAGTGSTTSIVLKAMHSEQGERLYEDYTITDVSAGFVNQAKERFSQYQNLKFAVCDVAVDPLEQGFEAASYDLIVAANVLHATPNLIETLSNCRKLLKPDGQLFMQEFSSNTRYADLIMGLFDGWWAGVEDGRIERPVIPEEEWDVKLRQSGFDGIHFAVRDNTNPHFFNTTNIVARPLLDNAAEPASDSSKSLITLLKPTVELGEFGQHTKASLEAAGYCVQEYVWGVKLPEDQDIISLIDVDTDGDPLLADVDAQNLSAFIDVIGDVSGQAVLWLMRPAQIQCSEPHYGQILGVARCIRAELAIDFITLELDGLGSADSHGVTQVLSRVRQARSAATENDSLDIESEYVWRNGQVLVSRIHTSSVDSALTDTALPITEGQHLVIGQPGMLNTMHWARHPLPPVAAGQVQIRVKVTGLNFHDVAVAMGIVGPDGDMEDDGYHGLGSEGIAVVTGVGPGVTHIAVGDRVVFMEILTGCFATEMQLPAALVARAPEGVNDEDAASLIVPYATVLWSLLEKAHIKRGQTLLIHSAAGGIGIAAIHVARWLGVEFYCTVGSPAKIDFLTRELGVPKERVFHSRDDSFVADVMRATNGIGVDLVLNSLSGELLHASWKCVAAGGSMVDLGKRDFLGRGQLAMHPFVGNRAFFGVDLGVMIINSKEKLVPFLNQAIDLVREGKTFPLHPTTIFEVDKIQEAFRYMQKGVHMGRIVVRIPEDEDALPRTLSVRKIAFDPDACYLLAGGLGGLGQSILSWMVSHGARHLAVLSPSAGTQDRHQQFINELRELNCELRCFAGDVADLGFLREVVTNLSDRPIKGVVQLAMKLQDTGFLNMDHESWSTVTAPKVRGTMNLHQLLPRDMDFFIMCGSTSGTLGAAGQANYAAANAYLDSFVHFRHAAGLPASVLDIAAIGDVGYVASNKNVAERLGRALAHFMTEREFLRCLQLAVERSSSKYVTPIPATSTVAFQEATQVVLYNDTALPLSDPRNTTSWRRDPRLSVFRNHQGGAAQNAEEGSEGLRSFLASLPSEPERLDAPSTVTFFAQEIAKRIFAFLIQEGAEIDTSQTLSSMGADSLVAIEIRNWWKQTLGIEVTALELADASNTMELLGALAVQRLKQKLSSA